MVTGVTMATSRSRRTETHPANAALAASKLSRFMADSLAELQAAINKNSSDRARG